MGETANAEQHYTPAGGAAPLRRDHHDHHALYQKYFLLTLTGAYPFFHHRGPDLGS